MSMDLPWYGCVRSPESCTLARTSITTMNTQEAVSHRTLMYRLTQ